MCGPLLNVADIRCRSQVNGPGIRSVVWVQGCTLGCPGCFNPHTHLHEKRHLFEPQALGRHLARAPKADGITLSGGEPFEQAEACAILAETVRELGLSVMVFTGYPFHKLQESEQSSVKGLLKAVDLLIAGPYVERLKTKGTLWQASANQTIHLLTDRLADAVASVSPNNPVAEIICDGVAFEATGFPDVDDQRWLEDLAKTRPVRGP